MTSSIFQSLMLPMGISGPGLDALLDGQSMLLSRSLSDDRPPMPADWGVSGSGNVGSSGVTRSSLIFVSCGFATIGVIAGLASFAADDGLLFDDVAVAVTGVDGSESLNESFLRLGIGESVPRDCRFGGVADTGVM